MGEKFALQMSDDKAYYHYARSAHNALSREVCIARVEKLAGIIIVSRQLLVSQVINDLEIIVSCSDMIEWENVIKHLPL